MKSIGIIPARYASTRFPGKPLAEIGGKPMVQRVYEQCLKSKLDEVVVATDDDRIASVVKAFGDRAVMTDPAAIDPVDLDTVLRVLAAMDELDEDHPDFIAVRQATARMFKAVKKNRRLEKRAVIADADRAVVATTATVGTVGSAGSVGTVATAGQLCPSASAPASGAESGWRSGGGTPA